MDQAQFDKIMHYIGLGRSCGAKMLAGGNRIGTKGFYIEPTVFADVQVTGALLTFCWLLALALAAVLASAWCQCAAAPVPPVCGWSPPKRSPPHPHTPTPTPTPTHSGMRSHSFLRELT